MWVFPEIVVPPNPPFLLVGFPLFSQSILGGKTAPIFGSTPMLSTKPSQTPRSWVVCASPAASMPRNMPLWLRFEDSTKKGDGEIIDLKTENEKRVSLRLQKCYWIWLNYIQLLVKHYDEIVDSRKCCIWNVKNMPCDVWIGCRGPWFYVLMKLWRSERFLQIICSQINID